MKINELIIGEYYKYRINKSFFLGKLYSIRKYGNDTDGYFYICWMDNAGKPFHIKPDDIIRHRKNYLEEKSYRQELINGNKRCISCKEIKSKTEFDTGESNVSKKSICKKCAKLK